MSIRSMEVYSTLLLLLSLVLMASCGDAEQTMSQITTTDSSYTVIGDSVDVESAMAVVDLQTVIGGGESMDVTFAGRILDFTPAKRCWIRIEVGELEEKMIMEFPAMFYKIDECTEFCCCSDVLDDYIGYEAIFEGNWFAGGSVVSGLWVDGVAIKTN